MYTLNYPTGEIKNHTKVLGDWSHTCIKKKMVEDIYNLKGLHCDHENFKYLPSILLCKTDEFYRF